MQHDYPGVNPVRRTLADGTVKVYYYHRATGRRLEGEMPAPGEPLTAESKKFHQSYLAAERAANGGGTGAPPRQEKSFGDLVDGYLRSPEFLKNISPGSQRQYRRALEEAKRRFSWMFVSDLNRREVRNDFFEWRDELHATPWAADSNIQTLSRLLSWAYDRALINVNHAQKIGRLVKGKSGRADKVFTPEIEETFLARANQPMRELYLFSLYSAARESDDAAMSWPMFDGRWLSFQPGKTLRSTGVWVHLPVYELPPFAALLAGLPRRGEAILTTLRGKAWTDNNIRKRFAAAMAEAGLGDVDLHFHDIRGTTVSRLYQAGCTDAEVASITGHAIGGSSELGKYAERSRALAVNAYRKWAKAMGAARLRVVS